MRYVRCLKDLHNCLSADLVTVLQHYWIKILEVYGNFEYWTRYDELLIMMKVTEK